MSDISKDESFPTLGKWLPGHRDRIAAGVCRENGDARVRWGARVNGDGRRHSN